VVSAGVGAAGVAHPADASGAPGCSTPQLDGPGAGVRLADGEQAAIRTEAARSARPRVITFIFVDTRRIGSVTRYAS
jgi:hypothetical protein